VLGCINKEMPVKVESPSEQKPAEITSTTIRVVETPLEQKQHINITPITTTPSEITQTSTPNLQKTKEPKTIVENRTIIVEKTIKLTGTGLHSELYKNESLHIVIDSKYCQDGYLILTYKIKNPNAGLRLILTTNKYYEDFKKFGVWTSYGLGDPVLTGDGEIKIYPERYNYGWTGIRIVPNILPYGTTSEIYFKVEKVEHVK